jgi:integrase
MIRACRGKNATRNRALLLVLWCGALRRSELAALTVGDVAFTDGGVELTVRLSKTDVDGQGHTLALPSSADAKACPVQALRAWLAKRAAEGSLFGLGAAQVNNVVRRLSKLAGAPTSAHGARRGWITSAVRSGRRVDEIRSHSRHASLTAFSEYVQAEERWANPIRLL